MYALASLWRPSGVPWSAALPVAFAWQAWDLVHCKGVGCTPWRPSGVPLASLWRPLVSAALPLAFGDHNVITTSHTKTSLDAS